MKNKAEYVVEMTPAAMRDFDKLTHAVQRRIIKTIDKLERNPRPSGVKKLTDMKGLFCIKAGDFRVVYTVDDKKRTVTIVMAADRKEIYRRGLK